MCGILGICSEREFSSKEVLQRLKRLEYRGYDSWGYWNGTQLMKQIGHIAIIDDKKAVKTAISHTRWATHGGVTELNAHPHRAGKVTIVHNGIIENWQELKGELEARGNVFISETDSEVLAHFINDRLSRDKDMYEILNDITQSLEGTFATLIMVDGDERIFAVKRDSPLMLGLAPGRIIVASDLNAFSDVSNKAIYFGDDEYAVLSAGQYQFFKNKKEVKRTAQIFSWEGMDENKGKHEHFMHKEIHEQARVSKRLLCSLRGEQQQAFQEFVQALRTAKKVIITACGTAYFASLMAAMVLHKEGIHAQALIASEFENFAVIDKDTFVIAASQSGETMDTLEALKYAKKHGAKLGCVVNVPHSTIERKTALALRTMAGQEVAVASTKAFTNQLLSLVAAASGTNNGRWSRIPGLLEKTIALEPEIKRLAEDIAEQNDMYIIGRRMGYPIAREIALKIKEVSYVHAEGMMGGELKHGTIALIEEGTPVISLIFNDDARMRSSTQEVRARGAKVLVIGTTEQDEVCLPVENELEFGMLAAVVGQLLAYHIAHARNCPIDKPRNLAKSVTVK